MAIYNAFDDDEEEEKNNNFYLDDVFDEILMHIDFILQDSPNNCKNKSDSSSSKNEEQKEWLKNFKKNLKNYAEIKIKKNCSLKHESSWSKHSN